MRAYTEQEVEVLVSRLRKLDVCAVSDAMDRLKISGVVTGVPQASGSGRIAGRAVTFKVGVGEPPAGPPVHLGSRAIEAAGPNDIIVTEQKSGLDAGCWGGLLTLGAKIRGVAGVIADGPVRDMDEARAYGFPIFTRAQTAKTARGRVVELGFQTPVDFHGQTVEPGDFIVADLSGVAVISAADIESVLETAEAIAAKEALMAKALLDGRPISKVMGGDYEHMLKA